MSMFIFYEIKDTKAAGNEKMVECYWGRFYLPVLCPLCQGCSPLIGEG